jgi:hypothetical protein
LNSFIVLLPTKELACRVYNDGWPFIAPSIRLHIRRWTRQALIGGGGALPFLIDVELHGISGHTWEAATAEQLLGEFCMLQELHRDTEEHLDFHSFKLSAWCARPELIPMSMDLHIVEPLLANGDDTVTIRTLIYLIAISVSMADFPLQSKPLHRPRRTALLMMIVIMTSIGGRGVGCRIIHLLRPQWRPVPMRLSSPFAGQCIRALDRAKLMLWSRWLAWNRWLV